METIHQPHELKGKHENCKRTHTCTKTVAKEELYYVQMNPILNYFFLDGSVATGRGPAKEFQPNCIKCIIKLG